MQTQPTHHVEMTELVSGRPIVKPTTPVSLHDSRGEKGAP